MVFSTQGWMTSFFLCSWGNIGLYSQWSKQAAHKSWDISTCPLPSPEEPDNALEEADASADNTSSHTCSTRHTAIAPAPGGKWVQDTLCACSWLSAETIISKGKGCLKSSSSHHIPLAFDQLMTHWLTGRCVARNKIPVYSCPFFSSETDRQIKKCASVLIYIVQWLLAFLLEGGILPFHLTWILLYLKGRILPFKYKLDGKVLQKTCDTRFSEDC